MIPDLSDNSIASPLTGRFNFRKTLTGKLVLVVEEERKPVWPWSRSGPRRRWRKANVMDLAAPAMRTLIDLRSHPQYRARYGFAGEVAREQTHAAEITAPAPTSWPFELAVPTPMALMRAESSMSG